jgi:alpha-tubulin suppressor-like RCC1 family protein
MSDGAVWCWGKNRAGELGGMRGLGEPSNAPSKPGPVPGVANARRLALGPRRSCAVLADASVMCWGEQLQFINDRGALATGSQTTPRVFPGLGQITDIALGSNHACAVQTDRQLRCWGNGGFANALGLGSAPLAPSPPGVDAVAVAVGDSHTCTIDATGRVKCWGNNTAGQLGLGDLNQRSTPSVVQGLSGVVQIAASGSETCAVQKTGALLCWGGLQCPSLADCLGPDVLFKRPKRPAGLPGIRAISMAGGFDLALGNDGTVWQLGLPGALVDKPLPADVPRVLGLNDVAQIAAGVDQACALRRNGDVVCWAPDKPDAAALIVF